MANKFLWRKIGNASSDDKSRTIDYTEAWEAESVIDYLKRASVLKKKNSLIYLNGVGHFWIESAKLTRLGEPQPQGKLQYTYDYVLRIASPEDIKNEKLPPWRYPPSDLTFGQVTEEVAVEWVYPPDSMIPVRLVNTAGVDIEAAGTKGLLELSFNYAVLNFDPNNCWMFVDKINAYDINVCDFFIPARCGMIKSLSSSEKIDYTDDNEEKWRYWDVKVNMILHPESWNKKYLNLGCHVWHGGSLQQLWYWIDNDGVTHYEPYSKYLEWVDNSGIDDGRGEPVTEPMFLNYNGTGISGFYAYKAVPTYVECSPYYPADFDFLDLPKTRGWR